MDEKTEADSRREQQESHREPAAAPAAFIPEAPEHDRAEHAFSEEFSSSANGSTLAVAPQPGISPPEPSDRLPRRELTEEDLQSGVLWWVGAHGGAGESTLEELVGGTRAAGHAWPVSPDQERPGRTVLLARTHHSGLVAAQRALRDWASGSVPTRLEGLVLIADAPGKLPPDLRALVKLVASAAPGTTWHLPWDPDWRLGRVSLEQAPREARKLVAHLNLNSKEEP